MGIWRSWAYIETRVVPHKYLAAEKMLEFTPGEVIPLESMNLLLYFELLIYREEAMRQAGNPTNKTCIEMESHVFQKAKSRVSHEGGGGRKMVEKSRRLYRMFTKKTYNGKRSYKSHETLRKMTKVIGFCEQLTNCAQLLYERDFLYNLFTKTEKKKSFI